MFWNVFFEGAIYGCWLGGLGGYTNCFSISDSKLMFWNVFFEGAISLKFMAAALYFHGCWIVWLLILQILSKFSRQVKRLKYWHV